MQKNRNQSSNKKLTLILGVGVIGMFGFSYLLVPIFNWVCERTGINGKGVLSASTLPIGMRADNSRTIRVELTALVKSGLSFQFNPEKHWISLHPGERKLIYFYARNQSGRDITVQAVPSITPADAARFLKKTECFCFTQQFFYKNEKAAMPVLFFVDPDVPKEIKEMTLSYTLFDATPFVKKNQPNSTPGRIELNDETKI